MTSVALVAGAFIWKMPPRKAPSAAVVLVAAAAVGSAALAHCTCGEPIVPPFRPCRPRPELAIWLAQVWLALMSRRVTDTSPTLKIMFGALPTRALLYFWIKTGSAVEIKGWPFALGTALSAYSTSSIHHSMARSPTTATYLALSFNGIVETSAIKTVLVATPLL